MNGLRHKVSFVLVFGERGPIAERLALAGVEVRVVEGMRSEITPLRDLIFLFAIWRIIREHSPDIIHCHSAKAAFLGRVGALMFGLPVLYTVHGWGWRGMGRLKGAMVRYHEKLLSKIGFVRYIYVAQYVRDEAVSALKISQSEGVVIYNGVDPMPPKLAKVNDCFTIVMPARVCSAKDHDTAARAFGLFKAHDKRLIFCGEGTDTKEFRDRIEKISGSAFSRISFLGQVSNMAEIYANAEVVMLISHFEAFPLSILEAFNCGLPVIATMVGGIPEVIAPENGFLVRLGDPDAIVDALVELHGNSALRYELGASARESYLSKFTAKIMADQVYVEYEKLSDRLHATSKEKF